ncbi:hypothetical protein ES703_119188 [subsurface metagenome]
MLKGDIGIIDAKFEHRRISLIARCVLGIIDAYPGDGYWKYLSQDTIAQAAGSSRPRVIRAIAELEAVGYLSVDDSRTCNRYHVCEWVKTRPKIWVKPSLVRDDGLSICQACFVGYVKFRQGQNEATWPTYREAAESLGVSYHTIARAAASDAVLGFVEKIHRPERQKSKNEYYLTDLAWLETFVFRLESARPKRCALGQTNREGGYFKANSVRNDSFRAEAGLSFDCHLDREPYERLVWYGVNRFVAKAVAVQWRGDPESVRNMIVNGMYKQRQQERYWRSQDKVSPQFTLAGYVIGGLNIAMAEGHGINLRKDAEKELAEYKARYRVADIGVVIDSEFEQRREEQKSLMFSTPAKPITPYTGEELALIAQKRDKSDEEACLHRRQADATRRYYRGREWAKPA